MSIDFAAQRATMVESQVRVADVTDYAIQDAMRVVAREALLPADKAYLAYVDVEAPYAPGRWLLKARDVAKLLQAIRPKPGETALAIAAPYAAAVLEAIGLTVSRLDDGDLAKPAGGTFDVVVCEGAVSAVPEGWCAAIAAPHGRLGAVVRQGVVGRAELFVHTEAGVGHRDLFDCAPPIMAGFEPVAAFTF
ncbi:MAG TPA: protein-L-isoaspartate O-methyltransferase [Caulobacteraceae bacterium]|jgi:protein-L-isoaspartate(D-aspartate) O-methyltransferase